MKQQWQIFRDSVLFSSTSNASIFYIFDSPSVLDRLNALLEPNGVLSINERGVIDGHIPTIKPHPDFRPHTRHGPPTRGDLTGHA